MNEQTIALIKPDAVQRKLVGQIIGHIEAHPHRLTIVSVATMEARLTATNMAFWAPRRFYSKQHEGKPYFERLVAFMESGPCWALILEGDGAITRWRRLLSTLRVDLARPGAEPPENLLHGSDSRESFEYERWAIGSVL